MWMIISGADQQMKNNPGYYQSLVNSLNDYPNPNFNQIDLDLIRTFAEELDGFF